MSNEQEQNISELAFAWVKSHKNEIINTFASIAEYEPTTELISVFMAGSPGAGKTEVSKRLIERFQKKPVRIDADEIRAICPGYTGANASLFQKAATKGVNILYSHCLHVGLNSILDGTFAYGGALQNIQRSLDRGRKVEIYFVYQDPLIAWEFTKKREALERRNIPKEAFIRGFFESQENVLSVKEEYGDTVELNLFIKDFENKTETPISNVAGIDKYLDKRYSRLELEALLL